MTSMQNDEKFRVVNRESTLLSNGIVQAWYSSGAFREVGFMEFAMDYLKNFNKSCEIVEKFELNDKFSDNRSR